MATVPLHQGQEAVLAAADAEREEAGAKEARDHGRGGGGRQELQARLQISVKELVQVGPRRMTSNFCKRDASS